MKCICCDNSGKDLREGVCFDCAGFESMVADAVDMFDKPQIKLMGLESNSAYLSTVKSIINYARKNNEA